MQTKGPVEIAGSSYQDMILTKNPSAENKLVITQIDGTRIVVSPITEKDFDILSEASTSSTFPYVLEGIFAKRGVDILNVKNSSPTYSKDQLYDTITTTKINVCPFCDSNGLYSQLKKGDIEVIEQMIGLRPYRIEF